MSDEEEYDEELPAISVSARSEGSFELVMPCAEELAAERARESACERELRRLGALCERLDAPPPDTAPPARLTHSDSSESEGEAALAAALSALSVPRAAQPEMTGARNALLRALQSRQLLSAGAHLLHDYLQLSEHASPTQLQQATEQMVMGVCGDGATADCHEAWSVVAAWLSALLVEPPVRAAMLRRALHHVLDTRLQSTQIAEVARALGPAVTETTGGGEAAARALLALSDAARSGGAGGALFASLLLAQALRALLPSAEQYLAQQDEVEAGAAAKAICECLCDPSRGALAPRELYLALQLIGRALAAAGGTDGGAGGAFTARLLDAVAQAPCAASTDRAHAPDHLKVAVGVARLRLLFTPLTPPEPR